MAREATMLERVMTLLETIKDADRPLSASELARLSGVPMASTRRILAELARTGFVDRADGAYRIGMRLWQVAVQSSYAPTLGEIARPFLEDLHAVVQMPTLLSVIERDDIVNVETLHPRGPEPTNITGPGVRLPVLVSSPGMAIVAFLPREQREAVLQNARITRFTPYTVTDRAQLRMHVDAIRRTGYAALKRWIVPESTGVAVPILDENGIASAAVSVTVPYDYTEQGDLVLALRTTARSIARAISDRAAYNDPQLALRKLMARATQTR